MTNIRLEELVPVKDAVFNRKIMDFDLEYDDQYGEHINGLDKRYNWEIKMAIAQRYLYSICKSLSGQVAVMLSSPDHVFADRCNEAGMFVYLVENNRDEFSKHQANLKDEQSRGRLSGVQLVKRSIQNTSLPFGLGLLFLDPLGGAASWQKGIILDAIKKLCPGGRLFLNLSPSKVRNGTPWARGDEEIVERVEGWILSKRSFVRELCLHYVTSHHEEVQSWCRKSYSRDQFTNRFVGAWKLN